MTTALLMLLGSTAATDARQEKGQEGRSEGGHAQAAKRAGQHTQQAKPVAAQHTQAAHTRSQAKPAAQGHASAGESCAAKPGGNKSVARDAVHRRVDNAHYSRSFGKKEDAEAWAASYKGEAVKVHVDPRDPTRSVLREEDL